MKNGAYDPRKGHGQVLVGEDGLPVALMWVMVDDYFIHAPTRKKCRQFLTAFMNNMVRLGFICQCVKTSPPAQRQKFYGMIFDTAKIPTLLIPESKISRARATIKRIQELDLQDDLTRLSSSVLGGRSAKLVFTLPRLTVTSRIPKIVRGHVMEIKSLFGIWLQNWHIKPSLHFSTFGSNNLQLQQISSLSHVSYNEIGDFSANMWSS
jgi:hypothetical protein